MKIMIVTPYFLPKIGGLENYAYNLAKELRDRHGHEVFVVTANHEAKKLAEDLYDNIRVIRLPIFINLSNTPLHPLWYFMIRKIIKREKPDLINTHAPVPYIADMALLAAHKTPTIMTYHAGSMKKSSGIVDTILGIYENVFLPFLLHKASRVATVYPQFIESKLRARDHDKVFYAPPCIDPLLFKPAVPSLHDDTTTSLLFVGRIETTSEWKGLDVLLQAVKAANDIPGLHLRIVGSGDADDLYRQQAHELGIEDRVEFVGKLKGTALVEAYQRASMLVLPSKSDAEAFGTVIIEAMACGTPVVASRIGGVPNVIKATGGGILVQPNDVKALASAIRKLATDKALREQLARTGSDTVHRDFIWQTTANHYAQHLNTLTAPHKPALVQITPYFPPHLGGMENVAQEISAKLAENGNDVRVITSDISYAPNFTDVPALQGKVQRLKSTEIAHLPIMWNLPLRLLRAPRKSIFHVHIAQAFIPEISLLVARLGRSKFIAHFHLDVSTSGSAASSLFTLYKKTLFPLMLRNADRVIVFSETQQQLVITKYGVRPERAVIIPNGVRLPSGNTDRVYLEPGRQLLYVGRLSPQKRVDRLVEAMQYLPTDIHLNIVGAGESEAELRAIAATRNLKNVTFHGALFGDDLQNMYVAADAFVITSDREGMPLVVLEAMAAGLPIIASDVLGIRELVDGTGVLVKDITPERFASSVIDNLTPERLNKLSRASNKKAATLSWDVIIVRLQQLYDEVQT